MRETGRSSYVHGSGDYGGPGMSHQQFIPSRDSQSVASTSQDPFLTGRNTREGSVSSQFQGRDDHAAFSISQFTSSRSQLMDESRNQRNPYGRSEPGSSGGESMIGRTKEIRRQTGYVDRESNFRTTGTTYEAEPGGPVTFVRPPDILSGDLPRTDRSGVDLPRYGFVVESERPIPLVTNPRGAPATVTSGSLQGRSERGTSQFDQYDFVQDIDRAGACLPMQRGASAYVPSVDIPVRIDRGSDHGTYESGNLDRPLPLLTSRATPTATMTSASVSGRSISEYESYDLTGRERPGPLLHSTQRKSSATATITSGSLTSRGSGTPYEHLDFTADIEHPVPLLSGLQQRGHSSTMTSGGSSSRIDRGTELAHLDFVSDHDRPVPLLPPRRPSQAPATITSGSLARIEAAGPPHIDYGDIDHPVSLTANQRGAPATVTSGSLPGHIDRGADAFERYDFCGESDRPFCLPNFTYSDDNNNNN